MSIIGETTGQSLIRTPPLFRTFELDWVSHQPEDDLFPDALESDPSVFYHGTASTREEKIDRDGLLPHAAGVAIEEVCKLVECFELLCWNGARTCGYPVLRSYTLKNDFRDGDRSPVYLSDRPSQAIHFAIPSASGGEKIAACRAAIADLRRFLTNSDYREKEHANPEKWPGAKSASKLDAALLNDVSFRLSNLADLERRVNEEFARYQYGVIYAIRPPADVRSGWEDCRGMGWRVFQPIPQSWFVAKLRIYPPQKS